MIDTAGIRETEDIVEKIGVERARKIADEADLILYVVDGSRKLDENDRQILDLIRGRKVIVLLNKTDLEPVLTEEALREACGQEVIPVSAKEQQGIDRLEEKIQTMFLQGNLNFNDQVMLTNVRHKTAMEQALKSLRLVETSIDNAMPEDFFSIDLMDAYEHLGTILGESLEEDLVNEISAILYGEIDQFFARFLSLWYDRVDLKTRKNIRRLIELKCAAAVKSAAAHAR